MTRSAAECLALHAISLVGLKSLEDLLQVKWPGSLWALLSRVHGISPFLAFRRPHVGLILSFNPLVLTLTKSMAIALQGFSAYLSLYMAPDTLFRQLLA